jgi:hypothetical protein
MKIENVALYLFEVTQKDPRNIENFKIKTTGKKQMMFCIACLATK